MATSEAAGVKKVFDIAELYQKHLATLKERIGVLQWEGMGYPQPLGDVEELHALLEKYPERRDRRAA